MIIIGWWSFKHRTEDIGTLGYVPILCYISYLNTTCLQLLPVVSSCTASYPRFSSSLSDAAATLSLSPIKPMHYFSHHLQETQAPGPRADLSQRYIIGHVTIYCASIFCLFLIYTPISSKTASSMAAAMGGHPPPHCSLLDASQ